MVSRPHQVQPMPAPSSDTGGAKLRRLIQTFIRSMRLLSGDQTPCAQPLPVSHAHALMVLLEAGREGNRLSQRALGQALGIDKSNVARLCRRMDRAGHLVQSRPADDGRIRLLSLTAAGKRLATGVEAASRDRFERLMAAIPRRSRAGVLASLARLNHALQSEDGAGTCCRTRPRSANDNGDDG